MFSKKDLEQQYQVSDNTVYKTLKACGLDTAKEEYSDEEIESYFKIAREMLDAGKRYKDVEEYFGLADAEPKATEQHNHQSTGTAADAVGMATAEMAVDLVQDAVRQVAPHIPRLVAHSLAQEMQSPAMRSAFEDMRSEAKKQRSNNNAGVDFLLKKMSNNGARQITGGSNQALPEASEGK